MTTTFLSVDERKVDLAQPEFEGLWSHHKPYNVPTESNTVKLPGASKMEKVNIGPLTKIDHRFLHH
jgi:hypothetical protein